MKMKENLSNISVHVCVSISLEIATDVNLKMQR